MHLRFPRWSCSKLTHLLIFKAWPTLEDKCLFHPSPSHHPVFSDMYIPRQTEMRDDRSIPDVETFELGLPTPKRLKLSRKSPPCGRQRVPFCEEKSQHIVVGISFPYYFDLDGKSHGWHHICTASSLMSLVSITWHSPLQIYMPFQISSKRCVPIWQ